MGYDGRVTWVVTLELQRERTYYRSWKLMQSLYRATLHNGFCVPMECVATYGQTMGQGTVNARAEGGVQVRVT